jgi:hypothetical protein
VHSRRFIDVSLRKVGAALVVVGFVLSWWQISAAQEDSSALQLRKTKLEIQKLELEVAKLNNETVGWYEWLPYLTFVAGIAATAASFWIARWARAGALDQATHEKRLECYPQLVKATSQFAIYFPEDAFRGTASLTQCPSGIFLQEVACF